MPDTGMLRAVMLDEMCDNTSEIMVVCARPEVDAEAARRLTCAEGESYMYGCAGQKGRKQARQDDLFAPWFHRETRA